MAPLADRPRRTLAAPGSGGLSALSTEAGAARILEIATALCDLSTRLQSVPYALPCTLDTVSRSERGAIYIGLMPAERARPQAGIRPNDLIGAELEPLFYGALHRLQMEVLAEIARAPRSGPAAHGAAWLDDLLARRAAV
jgi:hypothetical protein